MKEHNLFWTITTDSKGRSIATTMGMKNQDGTGPFGIFVSDARVEELRQGGDFVHDKREVIR